MRGPLTPEELMTRTSFPLVALVLLGCPGGGDGTSKDTDSGSSGACEVSAAACDEDGDGFRPSDGDCDDGDSTVNPGASEVCDNLDNDCDGTIDEDVASTFYMDYDQDGFGNPDRTESACEVPDGYVTNGNDCDDEQPRAYPGNPEVCDGIDNNCDGTIDENVTDTYYADADSDGYGDAGAPEEACEEPEGFVTDNTDCDDSTNKSYPGNSEVCDTLDNDCDGSVDEGVTTSYYADIDDDGYGDASFSQQACALPTGYAENADDCDDRDDEVFPGATEYCDGEDDNCDGDIDEESAADATTWYADTDGDGYGDPSVTDVECYAPVGYVADDTDCDDSRAATNPAATEYCNGRDDNCNGTTDEDTAADALTWYLDADTDGFGNASVTDLACTQPSGYVTDDTDCDDGDRSSYPGGTEVCDGADNDCNGTVDDNPIDGNTYYADDDGDSFGDPSSTDSECSQPSGYVENSYDCDDTDAGEPVVADAYGGSSTGNGSAANPYSSLQDAVDDAWSCVIAYSGTYTEAIDLDGKSLDLWGVEGSELTTIDAALTPCDYTNPYDCSSALTIASGTSASPYVHGFTISGGTGGVDVTTSSAACADSSASHNGTTTCTVYTFTYCGGGVYVAGDDPVLDDVILYNNSLPDFDQVVVGSYEQWWLYSYGGGICVSDGNVTMDSVWMVTNDADAGGGLYVGATANVEFEHGVVAENNATDGGGIMVSGGTFSGTNAVVACNEATTDGGGVFGDDTAAMFLENMSLYGNESDTSGTARGADAWVPSTATFWMVNSIVENDVDTALMYGDGSATLEYNNVYNDSAVGTNYGGSWSAGSGSISAGGNFTRARCDGNPYNDDWTLDSYSSSVDAGDADSAYNDADGSRNDQGAYGGPGGGGW